MVIVGVDGSEDGRHALHWAAGEAARRGQPLHVMHAVDFPDRPLGPTTASEPDTMVGLDEARRIVADALADAGRTWPNVDVSGAWIVGPPWAVLTRAATESDLIVIGTHGRGHHWSVRMGSVAADVAHKATCPVVVVRTSRRRLSPEHPRGIVLGVDGSETSLTATRFAFAAASARQLPLTVVHAVWDPGSGSPVVYPREPTASSPSLNGAESPDIDDTIAGGREDYPDVGVVTRYENGRPAQVLADLSAGADLLVLGAHGQGTTGGPLLGSVSRNALQLAPCPVAVVRGSAQPDQSVAAPTAQSAGG
jgi:nucleotide-binding universal stress UspA family protein